MTEEYRNQPGHRTRFTFFVPDRLSDWLMNLAGISRRKAVREIADSYIHNGTFLNFGGDGDGTGWGFRRHDNGHFWIGPVLHPEEWDRLDPEYTYYTHDDGSYFSGDGGILWG